MKKTLRLPSQLLATISALALSACASQQGTMTSAYRGSQVASGPVAADDAAMKQKPGTVQSKRTASASSKSKGNDTEMNSTETTTVVGSSAVAAPDSEVKINQ